jgi:Membrane bound O-acyl transferase family
VCFVEPRWSSRLSSDGCREEQSKIAEFQVTTSSPCIRRHGFTPSAPVNRRSANTSSNSMHNSLAWLPSLFLPGVAIWLGRSLPPWEYMWVCAFAIFFGVKWLTWWRARETVAPGTARSLAYFFLWPGMDARTFFSSNKPPRPRAITLLWAIAKIFLGAAFLWIVARRVPATPPLCRGWVGLLGLILLLHFGAFELVALVWQRLGVNAVPIMQKPLSSRSISDFWGKRWNLGFRQLSYEFVFRPLRPFVGVPSAMLLVFLFSGLVHEVVISLPARVGYGLPTGYFLLQGLGVSLERSSMGRALGLRGGFCGWAFAAVIAACPAFWLFHPPFVTRVVLPFMEAIRAI